MNSKNTQDGLTDLDLLGDLDVAEPEVRGGALGEVGDEHAVGDAVVLVDDDDVGELAVDGALDHLLDGRLTTPHRLRVRDDAGELLHEGNGFLKRTREVKF